ncbi:MAG: hypothetical protein K1X61_08310 [Chitinophagales bacterium]|nr:hypothetical protein [Chitinophagales bacterium]
MNIQLIKPSNIYFDYIPSGYLSGQTIEEVTSVKTNVSQKFTTSFRELFKIGMTKSVGVLIDGIGGNASYNVSSETEFTTSFESSFQSSTEHTLKVGYKVPDNVSFGTIVGIVRFIFGGITFDVTKSYHLEFFGGRNLLEIEGQLVTPNLHNMLRANNTNNYQYTVIDNEKNFIKPVLALPFKGKTCYMESFLGFCNNPSHVVDDKYVIVLDGTQFIVCHHNNWKWFGGPGCNCTHKDNSNVILVNATDLDPAYALLSLSKGTT